MEEEKLVGKEIGASDIETITTIDGAGIAIIDRRNHRIIEMIGVWRTLDLKRLLEEVGRE